MIFRKNNIDISFDANLLSKLEKKFNLSKEIISLLISRGHTSEEQIDKFLHVSYDNFHNPFLLADMQAAVDKIKLAISQKQRVTILGDYDCDGISASTILYKYFKEMGVDANVFLPNRIMDGYGVTKDTIDKIIALFSPHLIITVDCGISAIEEIKYCKSKNIDIIVTDHHEVGDVLPNCLVINPKREDQKYPFSELCGAGVAFKLVQALVGLNYAKKFLSIAAIATVADIVPLIDENRAIVFFGLQNQLTDLPKGVLKLIKKMKIPLPIKSSDIAYKIAPKLNASGRLGSAVLSYNLFVEENDSNLNFIINEIDAVNEIRIENTNQVVDDAIKKLSNDFISNIGAIVLYDDNWEIGVLGIVCSRLLDYYNLPVCMLTKVDNEYRGSLRSNSSTNIFETLNKMKDILVKFGGHAQAGGVTVAADKIEEFATRFNQIVLENRTQEPISEKFYDLEFLPNMNSPKFMQQLQRLEPFGHKNEKPIFRLDFNNAKVSTMPKHPQHLKLNIQGNNFIAFNYSHYYHNLTSNSNKSVLFEINKDFFAGREINNFIIKNIHTQKLNTPIKSDVLNGLKLMQFENNNLHSSNKLVFEKSQKSVFSNLTIVNESYIENKLCSLIKNTSKGTVLAVSNFRDYETLTQILEKNNLAVNFDLHNITSKSKENTLIFAPFSLDFSFYENVVLFFDNYSHDLVEQLVAKNKRIFLVEKENSEKQNNELFSKILLSRKVFAKYHTALKKMVGKSLNFECYLDLFKLFKKNNASLTNLLFSQFVFVILVLKQLQIIETTDNKIIFTNNKNKLENSLLYQYFKLNQ